MTPSFNGRMATIFAGVRPTYDAVVEDVDIQQAPGLDDLPRDGDVLRGWRRVTTGMVVSQDDSGRLLAHRLAKHLADPNDRAVQAPQRDLADVDHAVFG